MWNAILIFFI